MAKHLRGSKQIITLSLDAELMRRVEGLAAAQGFSRSAMIERMIRDRIDESEMALKFLRQPAAVEMMNAFFRQPGAVRDLAKAMGEDIPAGEVEKFHRDVNVATETILASATGTPRKQLKKDVEKAMKMAAKKARPNK